jgi:hypothetical protein
LHLTASYLLRVPRTTQSSKEHNTGNHIDLLYFSHYNIIHTSYGTVFFNALYLKWKQKRYVIPSNVLGRRILCLYCTMPSICLTPAATICYTQIQRSFHEHKRSCQDVETASIDDNPTLLEVLLYFGSMYSVKIQNPTEKRNTKSHIRSSLSSSMEKLSNERCRDIISLDPSLSETEKIFRP